VDPLAARCLVTATQLGQSLAATRKRLHLTQTDVASQLGLSQNRVSWLETHPEDLSVKQLLAWCAVLKLELSLGGRPASPADQAEW
jgi:HTH-type transcriptional regulator/antitoxin HipB